MMRARLILCSCIALTAASRAQEAPPAERDPPAQREVEPAVDTSSATGDKPQPRSPRVMDRIELDTTQITGNRELPKVLYIVPWKRSDLGDLVGKPVNSLLDEVLAPVDRDVFKRENRYFRALQPDGESAPADTGAGTRRATDPPARDEK